MIHPASKNKPSSHIATTMGEVWGDISEYIPYPITPSGTHYLQRRDRLFKASIPIQVGLMTQKPILIENTQRQLNMAHPDVVLYVHPADVVNGVDICTIYDHQYRELGKVKTEFLIISPIREVLSGYASDPDGLFVSEAYKGSMGKRRLTQQPSIATSGYTTPYLTCVFMNTRSTIVYLQLVHGTEVRGTYRSNGRIYIHTKTPRGHWLGRGWINEAEISKELLPSVGAPVFTVATYIWTKMKNTLHGEDQQHEPDLGFTKFLLPGVLYNAYNTEPHFRCPDVDRWFKGKQEQFTQPLPLSYTSTGSTGTSIQQLLDVALRSNITEESAVSRSECKASGGKTSHRMLKTMPTHSPPPYLIVRVVRNDLYMDAALTVEDVPVRPSPRLTMFGKEYKLVSMAIKTGPSNRGHWMACVNTRSGWYLMNDSAPIQQIRDISKITNGVQFIYEEVDIPLFEIEMEGLENLKSFRCWANTFTQMVRYSPTIGSLIGITGRPASFNELFGLVDRTA
jgi:hypothetical protein